MNESSFVMTKKSERGNRRKVVLYLAVISLLLLFGFACLDSPSCSKQRRPSSRQVQIECLSNRKAGNTNDCRSDFVVFPTSHVHKSSVTARAKPAVGVVVVPVVSRFGSKTCPGHL